MGPAIAAFVAALALLSAPACSPATAAPVTQTVTHTVTVGPTFFETRIADVPQFNPSTGTLVSVEISGNVHDATYYGLEFQCTAMSGQSSLTWDNRSWTEITHGTQTDPAGSGGEPGVTLTADSTFDGTLDAAGTSGAHVYGSYDYSLGIAALSGTVCRPFVGTSTTPLVLTLHRTEYYFNEVGCPQHAVATSNEYTYTLVVTYTYT